MVAHNYLWGMTDTSPATWLSNRSVLRVSGAETRAFLQGLVTQDLGQVAPDHPQWSGLLTPQGKALFDFILWDGGDDSVLIDAESASAEALARRLTLYRLRRAVEIELVPDLHVHWALATDRGVPDPRLPALGHRWLSGEPGTPADADWLSHRLTLGVTEGVGELGSDKTLWLECNARELNGVSLTKGCYVGQENTARMHYRSKVNRRLMVAPLGDETERTRARYPALGLMVEHQRVEAPGDAQMPDWLAEALAEPIVE